MSWDNLEGGQESSHHSGAVYADQVEEYLESMEYLSVGDMYSGTSDIKLTRPAHNEEKYYRVETKNTKLDLKDSNFTTEIARHLIDYNFGDEEFELMIFAVDYMNQPRVKDIFRDRTRKRDEVEWFWEKICDNHTLNDDEAIRFQELAFDDFWVFLEKISVKKAGYGRLRELIDEHESKNRRQQKWRFYIEDKDPVPQPVVLTPNFYGLEKYPEHIWIFPSPISDPREFYGKPGVHNWYPIWLENDQLFSLIGPSNLPDSIDTIVPSDAVEQFEFKAWVLNGEQQLNTGKILLNRNLLWRGIQLREYCIKDPHEPRLIFRTRPVQGTLGLEAASQDIHRTEEGNYLVTRGINGAVAHRYCKPVTRKYQNELFVFLETGWIFSREGQGEKLIWGDHAKRLNDQLRSEGYDQYPNARGQFNAWHSILRMDASIDQDRHPARVYDIEYSQGVEFNQPSNLTTSVRPPKNVEERDLLMEGEEVS